MLFGKKKHWDDEYDEYYTQRDPEYGRRVKPLLWIHFAALTTLAGVFLVVVGASAGGGMVEDVLKALCTPVGSIWIGLALLTYFSLVYKLAWTAISSTMFWLILSVGGNWFVANQLASNLESDYAELNRMEVESFDYLIVLGGSTLNDPTGNPQLGMAGDRVMTAARMYHQGKTKKIIATGREKYKMGPKDMYSNEEVVQILGELNIPKSDLMMLGGSNTSEELEQIQAWQESLPNSDRLKIGILSSAWHLPRVMALADANGANVKPIPSNFIGASYSPNPSIVIPSAENLQTTATMLHEYLGRMIGR